MDRTFHLEPPFFEIGPKGYLYGDGALKLALAADALSEKYDVRIIFTPQYTDIYPIAHRTKNLLVCAPHMDYLPIGRGQGSVLPEAVKAAGARGVLLNHCEKPISFQALKRTIERADEVGLFTLVCADSIAEIQAVTLLEPNIVAAEPTELIGSGQSSDMDYVAESMRLVRALSKDTWVLQAAGISTGQDVYNVIYAGADATGSSSAICAAPDPAAVAEEMIRAVREAYDARTK